MGQVQEVKSILEKHGIRPSKKYGQNFLVADWVIEKMCAAAELTKEDRVVEVGPGLGMLTKELAKRAEQVLAVEIDSKLFSAAKEQLAEYSNVRILEEDILRISNQVLFQEGDPKIDDRQFSGRPATSYKVVASLPYSITSATLRKFTEEEPRPECVVVLVQKEVAQRVCAKPGEMSVLSVAVQYYGKPEIVARVPRSAFWPQPKVDSAILKIGELGVRNYESQYQNKFGTGQAGIREGVDEKRFFQVLRAGFSGKRKQLQNNLLKGLCISKEKSVEALLQVGLNPKIRPQDLKVEDWIALARII